MLPGIANPSDIEAALELGLTAVKFFPAEAAGGVKMLKAMSAPYGQLRFMPTGGINLKNLESYLSCPVIAACGGSYMCPDKLIQAGAWEEITELCRQSVEIVKEARAK